MSLKHSLLALLSRKTKTGYELSKDFDGSTGFFWNASHQQIYKELGELQSRGWVKHREVEQTEKPDKKPYTATEAGIQELKRWLKEPTEPTPSKDAFLIKLFVGDLVETELLLEDLARHKGLHQAKRQRYLEIERQYFQSREDLPIARQYQYLSLRRGITFESAWLNWCKEVEDFLGSKINKETSRIRA